MIVEILQGAGIALCCLLTGWAIGRWDRRPRPPVQGLGTKEIPGHQEMTQTIKRGLPMQRNPWGPG